MSGSAHILNSFLLFEKNIYFPLPQTELHSLKSALFFLVRSLLFMATI